MRVLRPVVVRHRALLSALRNAAGLTAPGSPADASAPPASRSGDAEAAPVGRSALLEARGKVVETLKVIALTLVIFFGIQTFVARPFQVHQLSMEPTFTPGDYLLVDKLTPLFDAYDRGDVVVFQPPADWSHPDGTPFVKRVIGVAGETVEIDDGLVTVDGIALDEAYLFAVDGQREPTEPAAGATRWVIGEGELFVLGDHRRSSQDSRSFGPIDVSDVVGRAWLRYWPLDALSILPTPRYPELAAT